MATKAQERKALEQIRKIVEGLGEDSYIGHAFEGCFEMAEENIDNDWWCSMKERAAEERCKREITEQKLAEATNHMADQAIELADKRGEIEEWEGRFQSMVNDKNIWRDDCIKTKESLKAEQSKNEALEQEIIKLKAKLYDMMTA